MTAFNVGLCVMVGQDQGLPLALLIQYKMGRNVIQGDFVVVKKCIDKWDHFIIIVQK